MSQVYKIVLTGGPCGGKTTAIHFLKQELTHRGIAVFCLDEMATKLKNAGKTPENMGNYAFHSLLFREQLKTERSIETSAAEAEAEKSVILCDRGLLDNKAYVSGDDFRRYSSECGCHENQLLCSYDAVFHLVTAAKGAAEFYTTANNNARTETVEEAAAIDDKLIAAGEFPIARWGKPQDIANAVSLLISDKLMYTTGNYIDVDGGFHIRRL